MLADCLAHLTERRHLDTAQMRSAIHAIMSGQCAAEEIAGFLTALRMKGETAEEIAAAAQVLRDHAMPFDTAGLRVLDTCGTGGDGMQTVNVSTAAALVAAACGVPVAKHGNRGVSSASGSADVLAALGVPVELEPEAAERCFQKTGFAFCFAPRFHPAMKHVASVRKALRIRTVFNLLGPLSSPARAAYQVIGVGDAAVLDRMAEALVRLGVVNAFVVHANDGLDEVSLGATTQVRHVRGCTIHAMEWQPEEFGMGRVLASELRVSGATESAARIRGVLAGERTPCRDVVLANAGVALLASEKVRSLTEGVRMAAAAIDEGRGARLLQQLVNPQT